MRVAAIDVGTNSIHLLVAEISSSGRVSIVEKARAQVMLGRHGLQAHRITDDAFARGLETLRSYKELADSLDVVDIHTAATSAVREAENGPDFCRAVRETTGVHVRIVSGAEEARLIWLGARDHLDYSRGAVMLCDLGGGSTEMILCDHRGMRHAQSLPLGHIRVAERFLQSDPLSSDERRSMRRFVRELVEPLARRVPPKEIGSFVGTSGAIRTLARMATLRRGDPLMEHGEGLVLYRRELEQFLDDFTRLPRSELSRLPGFDDKRRETLPAAAVVIREIMKAFDAELLTTSERSLRDGLLVDWVERHRPEIDLSRTYRDPRERSVRLAMQRFGKDDVHVRYTTKLALDLFDATADLHQLPVTDRDLLRAASLLHDIGHHIADKNHHKHGQYLLKHIRMYGFTAPEVAMMSNIVRYHSRSMPKGTHKDWRLLSKDDRQRVRVMAGLLRIADAFDRSHNQPVHTVEVTSSEPELVIRASCSDGGDLERWAANERTDLLASALHRHVRVDVVRAAPPVDDLRELDASDPAEGTLG